MKTHIKSSVSVCNTKDSLRVKALSFPVYCALFTAVFLLNPMPVNAGSVHKDVPKVIDSSAKYIFYMHGLAIEQGGQRAKKYRYTEILKELAKRGFVVIGEKRNRVKNLEYADKVARQVRVLLNAGVPARNITVAGHSKGGLITMLVMPRLNEPDIAYVNFAGCGKETSGFTGYLDFAAKGGRRARGRLLSAYDASDTIAGSCKQALDAMTNAEVTERVLDVGLGHELFYRPSKSWIDILVDWADRKK